MTIPLSMLNQAMLTQVLHELRLGNLQRCKALGLEESDISVLQSLPPATLSRLANAQVAWVDIRIDPLVFRRIIDQAEQDEQCERLVKRALSLGASSSIMYKCFGMLHSETATRRRLLNLPIRKGRPHALSEAQEHAIWQRWTQLNQELNPQDPADKLDAMMMIAEEQQVSLASVWYQVVQHGGEP